MQLKRFVRRGVARVAPPSSRPGTRVLMYHAVDDPDPADVLTLRVPPERFAEQMALLKDRGYVVVPLHAVLDAADETPRVAITFDDGYRSQLGAAAILRRLRMPATFFVAPRFLDGGGSPRDYSEAWTHMTWDEAASLIADGFEVGAHSSTHVDLRRCTAAQLDEETSGARRRLEDRLQVAINAFSYPYGRHDDAVQRAVERAGYRLACTSRYGLNCPPVSPYLVHRIEVAGRDSLRDFEWKLQGKYDWVGRWQDLTATR